MSNHQNDRDPARGGRSKRAGKHPRRTVEPRGEFNLRAISAADTLQMQGAARSPTQLTRVAKAERFEGVLKPMHYQTSAGLIETRLLGTVTALIRRREIRYA